MKVFPALSFQMSTWNYYVIKMNARDLSENIKFAHEVHEDKTLDMAIQRALKGERVINEIVPYLQYQEDRFFSALVIAALEGNPKYHPQNDMFGYLEFDGTQEYYALDGQHRLSAVKMLMDDDRFNSPENFEKDEFSVIVIVPKSGESREDFMKKYRKLFSTLNRYAKKTDYATNIIMDEDDMFAILTRRLIMDHEFFRWTGYPNPERIKTTGGIPLKEGATHFTSIETLYEMNIALLSSPERVPSKWGSLKSKGMKAFQQIRPPEEYIETLYNELEMYWDALLTEFPVLREHPSKMRYHEMTDRDRFNGDDHLLFWPMGQMLLAEIARKLIDKQPHDPKHPTPESVGYALRGLGSLEWRLYCPPWQFFLIELILDRRSLRPKWKLRGAGAERKPLFRCAYNILSWSLDLEDYDQNSLANLKKEWESLLRPPQPQEKIDEFWQQVTERREMVIRKRNL